MARFCAYADKLFGLSSHLGKLTDARVYPQIPTAAVFAGVFTLFATRRGSLNGLEQDLRMPARLRGIVGPEVPSVDSIGRVYALMKSQPLRQFLGDISHRLKRNKALSSHEGWYVAAIDGHEFFSSRKRCCPDCQQRCRTIAGKEVTEYYHQGVVCHLIGQNIALVLDVELLRPGEGEETAAKRLLERVFADYPRFFDIVVADALYFDAPFINFCLERRKHVIVTAKGDHRLLVQDAQGLFAQRQPGCWVDGNGKRNIRFWDEEGFTSCAPKRRCGVASESPGSGTRRNRRRPGHGPQRCPRLSCRRVGCGDAAMPAGTSRTTASTPWQRIGVWTTASSTRRLRLSIFCSRALSCMPWSSVSGCGISSRRCVRG
jgi:hypothetical protein